MKIHQYLMRNYLKVAIELILIKQKTILLELFINAAIIGNIRNLEMEYLIKLIIMLL